MPRDFPFYEVVAAAERYMQAGHDVHQKFTCVGCGARLGIDTPNVFHKLGTCDKCPAVTNIERQGCNYLIHMKVSP